MHEGKSCTNKKNRNERWKKIHHKMLNISQFKKVHEVLPLPTTRGEIAFHRRSYFMLQAVGAFLLPCSACPKQCEGQNSRTCHETCGGKKGQGIDFQTAHSGQMARPRFLFTLKGQETGPLLVLELTIVQCPQKHKKADHQTNEHVRYEVRVIHGSKSKFQISKPQWN
jgi:hypothetical protein